MSKPQSPKNPQPEPGKSAAAAQPPPPKARIFRKIDWITFGAVTLLTLIGYLFTIAPDVTLEDSGELAVASMYAGVPHPPGYPVWTIYTWLFTKLLPFSNIAWRVAVSSAFAAAVSCGLLALLTSRGCSTIIERIPDLKTLDKKLESMLCLLAGFAAGILLGFNGFMWSQAVIVEVYTLSVVSLMGVLCTLFRWVYAPEEKRYLYYAAFWFGICFTTHQTLIVAAMGIQVLILLVNIRIGRDLFMVNSIVYVLGLLAMQRGKLTGLSENDMVLAIYHFVGIGSLIVTAITSMKTRALGTEWKPIVFISLAWFAAALFYFYMPLASMTNPPLNWGYPRTEEGFWHALTRGQYDKTNPTSDPIRFAQQVIMYFQGASEEFMVVYLLIALIPFVAWAKLHRQDKAWLIGSVAIFSCLAFLLLILLNPNIDRQSRSQTAVFFTASHVILAMFVGYGLTIALAFLATNYQRYRLWGLYGSAVAVALALGQRVLLESEFPLDRFTTTVSILIWVAVVGAFWLSRTKAPITFLLVLMTLLPLRSVLAHWSDNEQRGHLFGYWFGHDMFTPPFDVYPEMAKDAILFGGTDPGRFNPTYMIFCESFIKPEQRRDPKFDRRDVYLITQNALADGTYLAYIRAHYNRSAQKDPPFFTEFFRSEAEAAMGKTNLLARMFAPLDRIFGNLGERIEKERRERGVYPPKEIITPSVEDSSKAFQDYIADAQRRLQHDMQNPQAPKQIKPGEDVRIIDNRISVQGQVAVMSINALLTKVIFDKNPGHEFYVEESFPLDWMFPHLEPFGIIMKINRNPLPELTQEMVDRDHKFWTNYSERLVGNWIGYDTTVKEVCEFADRVYLRRDFEGFTGDRKFIRDDNAQKAFSKLRSAQAGLYFDRLQKSKSPAEHARMQKECEFALKQSFAFCPYSPEAVYKYANLLLSMNRVEDAELVAATAQKQDKESEAFSNLLENIKNIRASQAGFQQIQDQLATLEAQYATNKTNLSLIFQLASTYLQMMRTNSATALFEERLKDPNVDIATVLTIAGAYDTLTDYAGMERTLIKAVQMLPDEPNSWYDLARAQVALSNYPSALTSITRAIELSRQRQAQAPGSRDLAQEARTDARLAPLRQFPEFIALINARQIN